MKVHLCLTISSICQSDTICFERYLGIKKMQKIKNTFLFKIQGYFNVARKIQNPQTQKGKHNTGIMQQYDNNFCLQEKK